MAGQLFQYDNDNNIAVIAFTSRIFKGAEINYHTTEKKLLSIIYYLKKFRVYLMGNHYTIITDNKALMFLHKCDLSSARMACWILAIQEYDFSIQHCKGRDNIIVDVLSRHPEDIDGDLIPQEEIEINQLMVKLSKDSMKSLKQLPTLQKSDTKLKNIFKKITENNTEEYQNNYLFHEDFLYRKDKKQ